MRKIKTLKRVERFRKIATSFRNFPASKPRPDRILVDFPDLHDEDKAFLGPREQIDVSLGLPSAPGAGSFPDMSRTPPGHSAPEPGTATVALHRLGGAPGCIDRAVATLEAAIVRSPGRRGASRHG
ncbi:MAG: hypothetical protein WBA42_09040, partial [Mesorhizobium sp.]